MAAPLRFYGPLAAQVVLMLNQIRSFERLPREQQDALQRQQLHTLLCHAQQYSPYWAQRLKRSGFDPARPDISAFHRLPELYRSDLQTSFEAARARWPGLTDDHVIVATTSGSTGAPVRVEKAAPQYSLIYQAIDLLDAEWHRRDPSKTLAWLGVGLKDAEYPGWGEPFESLGQRGKVLKRCLGGVSTTSHLEWLLSHRPDYLKCSPFVAADLAQLALDRGVSLSFHHILSQSERVTPRQRALCQQAFGAKIVDRYSCEESGWIALQCPQQDQLHVLNPSVLVEIVDDQGQPCPPGEVGKVLITSLHSFAMPIIRYDIGDLAAWGPPCDCGMTLPVIARLWGRTRHRVRLPSGEYMPMAFIGDEIGEIEPVREFRVMQYRDGELLLQIKAARPLSDDDRSRVRRIIDRNGLAGLPLFIREVEQIDWGPGWKREEFVRLDLPLTLGTQPPHN